MYIKESGRTGCVHVGRARPVHYTTSLEHEMEIESGGCA